MTFERLLEKAEKQKEKYGYYTPKYVMALQPAWAKNKKCEKCGSTEEPTADHIVPACILRNFGFDTHREWRPEWLQVLCRPCNKKKGSDVDWNDVRTYAILDNIIKHKMGDYLTDTNYLRI